MGANQQSLLARCEALAKPAGKSGAQLLSLAVEWGDLYNECAARHNGLVDALAPR